TAPFTLLLNGRLLGEIRTEVSRPDVVASGFSVSDKVGFNVDVAAMVRAATDLEFVKSIAENPVIELALCHRDVLGPQLSAAYEALPLGHIDGVENEVLVDQVHYARSEAAAFVAFGNSAEPRTSGGALIVED